MQVCIIHIIRPHPSKLGHARVYSWEEAAGGLSSAGWVSPGVFYSLPFKCHELCLAFLMVSAPLALTRSHIDPMLLLCL